MVPDAASEDELTGLSGAELVDRLRTTYRRADFDAVARVLDARDSRLARVEADLAAAIERERVVADAKAALETEVADLCDLRSKYEAFLGAHRQPRDEDENEKMPLLVRAASTGPVQRDEEHVQEGKVKSPGIIDLCSDEEEEERAAGPCKGHGDSEEREEDTEPLSQRWKRLRRGVTRTVESGEGNGQGQRNSVGTLAHDQQRSSSESMDGPVARTEQIMCTPEDSNVAAFVQGRGVVKLGKFDHGKAIIDQKKGSSDGIPARGVSKPPNVCVKMSTPTVVKSSAKCEKKEVGTGRHCDERMVSTVGAPFESDNGKSTSIIVKRESSSLPSSITKHWESEGHMVISFIENKKLCMEAVCALYHQRKLTIENTGFSKSDVCRATKLVEFLLDGDLQGPMIRTAEEHDACFLKKVAMCCSEQLFNIYRNKEDPYFC